MFETTSVGYKRFRAISLFVILSVLTTVLVVWAGTGLTQKIISERQAKLVAELRDNFADSPAFLVEQLFEMQENLIPLFVPGMPKPVCLSAGLLSFDPKTFPETFLNGLVYEPEYGSPVYHLKLREVRATREIEVLDADGKVFYVFKPSADYDPLWLAKRKHPEIFAADYAPQQRSFMLESMEPSHIEMEIALIPVDYIEVYAEEKVASLWDALQVGKTSPTLAKPSLSGGMTMMRSVQASSNIVVDEISRTTTGMSLVVSYPDNFTNRLEVFYSSNLMDKGWALLATNIPTTGSNTLTWVDRSATNDIFTNRFYVLGNADIDSDEDGIVDGREILMFGSNPSSSDSDGDGLVDGYSGVVSTNSYPAGVATNGNLNVEGEISWRTDSAKFDTDGDMMGDGWEVKFGHNPLDPNDPPNVSGTVSYSGRQTGTLWVVAVTDSNSWSTANFYTSAITAFPRTYLIPNLEETNYWIKAWLDSNNSGQTNASEAQGIYTNVQSIVTNRVMAKNFTLSDPDSDSDSLPDWWEIHWFGSTTNYTSMADPDGDSYNSLEEYDAATDPTDIASHPWSVSGMITYTGPQTGIIHVVACTNGTDWGWARSVALTNSGAFTINHLPPDANYWLRAWVDSNGNGLPTSWEAWGSHNSNPVFLDANLTGQDISLADPDVDQDGFADWWEVLNGLDPTRGGEDGAVAWWKLDEGAGTDVSDTTANANNGILKNGSTAWGAGIISNALSLNGTNAYVEVPDSASLKPNAVSVGLWITPSKLYTNGTAMFVSKRVPSGSAGYSLGYENGKVVFTFCSSGAKSLGYSCALTSGVPVHVAGSFGGTLQTLFLNGVKVASSNYDWRTGFGAILQDTNVVRLGSASGANPTNFFAGMLDDVRILPSAWTTNDVKAIWELGADSDGDGLSNWREHQLGTSPNASDTDGDGFSDSAELALNMNPANSADGLAMLVEARSRIALRWGMINTAPLIFTNTAGSSDDLHDMDAALSTLSTNFYYATNDILAGGATNYYHSTRSFVPVTYFSGSPLAYSVIVGASNLTDIICSGTNVVFDTNNTYAIEYESVALGYASPEAAWYAVTTNYSSNAQIHSNVVYDNVGWVKGTHPAYGTWGGFLWLLQNHATFKTSPTNFWVSSAGVTNQIDKVLVGTVGDYHPATNAVDVGPTNWVTITNYLGSGGATDVICRAEYNAYYKLYIPKIGLIPDYNRDGGIDSADQMRVSSNETFHFWVNDDNDSGTEGGDDIPGNSSPNSGDGVVNGVRDLVDFFPVWVDIKDALAILPPDTYDYVLKQQSGALNAFACNSLPVSDNPDLKPNAFLYATNFGSTYGAFSVGHVTSSGLVLSSGFLSEIADNGRGIVLLEGRAATTDSLVLEIRRKSDGTSMAQAKLPLDLAGVENMFRHINLRPAGSGGHATATGEPSRYPDSLCTSNNVFFVHGFNVTADGSRGWNAEMFKRLYWSGSNAKFWGMTWEGDVGLINALNYQADVANALTVSSNLYAQINGISGGKIILAHSLGNMVVSSAIQDFGLSVSKYLMLDAAVASECYDPMAFNDSTSSNNMLNLDWLGYNSNVWCSTWFRLFSSPDARANLTWQNRFSAVASVAHNFYSSGDSVLEIRTNGTLTSFSGLLQWHLEQYAWHKQEMFKGRTVLGIPVLGGTSWAGWGFSGEYTTTEANAALPDNLRTNSVFRQEPTTMFSSNITDQVVNDIIAQGVPALSWPVGFSGINLYGFYNYDANANAHKPNGWGRSGGTYQTRWLHSDLKDMAYLYTYDLFNQLVTEGGLK